MTELQERVYQTEFERISKMFPYHMTKLQVCMALGIETTQLEKMMKNGTSPRFKKRGASKQSPVVFTVMDVAMYEALGVTMKDYE